MAALLHDGCCTFEFGIVAEVFGLPRPEMGPGGYRFASVTVEEGPLRAHGGLGGVADAPADLLDRADLIVVPGWRSAGAPVPEALSARLCAAHARGARIASIRSGAFGLAAAGLLDGGTATPTGGTPRRCAPATPPSPPTTARCIGRRGASSPRPAAPRGST